jgi:hypothetical protein
MLILFYLYSFRVQHLSPIVIMDRQSRFPRAYTHGT